MSATIHTIAVDALHRAIRLLVRGFGSAEAEVDAVSDEPHRRQPHRPRLAWHRHAAALRRRVPGRWPEAEHARQHGARQRRDAAPRRPGRLRPGDRRARRWRSASHARATHGSCIVALGNAHHLGRIGAWAEQAAAAGLVSLHFVNVISRAIVAPYGGADARFGTNPFCAGVPFRGREPVILDFATSMIAQGKTRVANNKGELVAPGCLIDDHGRPTREPRYQRGPAVRRAAHLRRAQGLRPGAAVRTARRRAGRRHDAARPRQLASSAC